MDDRAHAARRVAARVVVARPPHRLQHGASSRRRGARRCSPPCCRSARRTSPSTCRPRARSPRPSRPRSRRARTRRRPRRTAAGAAGPGAPRAAARAGRAAPIRAPAPASDPRSYSGHYPLGAACAAVSCRSRSSSPRSSPAAARAPPRRPDFEGEEKAVADQVEKIQSAGEARDAKQLCDEVLATELRDAIADRRLELRGRARQGDPRRRRLRRSRSRTSRSRATRPPPRSGPARATTPRRATSSSSTTASCGARPRSATAS